MVESTPGIDRCGPLWDCNGNNLVKQIAQRRVHIIAMEQQVTISDYERREFDSKNRKIADACPACGFKFADRSPAKIGKSVWPVANLSVIAAAAADGIFFVAWLMS